MPKAYIVDGGAAARPMIDDLALGGALRGVALSLELADVQQGKRIRGPGRDMAPFRNSLGARRSIFTTGLGHCIGIAVVWGKIGQEFEYGYCAHISNVQRRRLQDPGPSAFEETIEEIGVVAQHNPWVAISINQIGPWSQTLVTALTGVGIADDHIWLYQREHGSNTFGVDKLGRFGVAPGVWL